MAATLQYKAEDYTVGWICALTTELTAARSMLDELHDNGRQLPQDTSDKNNYVRGQIHGHNIVIARSGAGTTSAAVAATHMLHTYPNIRFGLLVGIAGGAPRGDEHDIRLGDIVIGMPTKHHGGVVQVDFGTQIGEGVDGFKITGQLGKPPRELANAVEMLRSNHDFDRPKLQDYISPTTLRKKYPQLVRQYCYSTEFKDNLFEATYPHQDEEDKICTKCDEKRVEKRAKRLTPDDNIDTSPRLHYGNIASANRVMRYAKARDEIAKAHDILCFEEEAAGLADDFQCIVVRGICDYADSHKNKKWQNYAALVAAAYAKELLSVIPETLVKGMVAIKPTPISNVPFPRNPNFVGRQSLLNSIDKMLFSKYCPCVSIFGLGGVGKTQIVLEYIYRHQAAHPDCAVFWVPALSAATFDQAYKKIAEILKISQMRDKGIDFKQLVKDKLSDEGFGKWLLVVDNADSTDVLLQTPQDGSSLMPLKDYLPKSSNGSIIFTTRTRKAAGDYSLGAILEAIEMDKAEAGKLFESYLAPKQILEEDSKAIAQLLEHLTCLPLAIRQAAAFIQKNDVSVSKYLSLYEKSEQSMVDILSEDFQDPTRYSDMKNPVAATWLVSFKQIRHEDPQAANYLSFMSTLLRENIPQSLLPTGESDLEQTKAIGTLTAYSFLTHRKGEEAFDVHRLVYLATRNWLRRESKLSFWTDNALRRLVEVIPAGGHLNREIWTQYLPHGVYVADKNEISRDGENLMIMLMDRIGLCQSSLGQYAGAEKFHRRALALREEMLGSEHPDTLMSMNEVGFALSNQGKYTEAEEIHQETLALKEKVLGKEHPETLTSMNNIGYVLSKQWKYIEAEEIYRKTLTLREKVLGKEHPHTLSSMNNIGDILSEQEKYIEAEEIYREILTLREKILGKEYPSTLISMESIGYILSKKGKYIEAEEICRETLALREQVLGKEHPDTLTSMNAIGVVLGQQGKNIEAEEIHWETLALREQVLGKEHPDTQTSMDNIGYTLSEQGKYRVAEEIYRETIALREKVLGKEHPRTLTSMNSIGHVLSEQGKYREAEEIYRETIALREKVLGKEHPRTLTSMNRIGHILSKQGKYAEARRYSGRR